MENKIAIVIIVVVLLLLIIGHHFLKTYRSFKAYMFYMQAGVISEENADMAIKLLEEAVKIDPYKPEFRWNLASMYYNQGRIDDAISQLECILKQDPNALSVKKLLIMALLKKGNKMAAKEIYKTINESIQDSIFHNIFKNLD